MLINGQRKGSVVVLRVDISVQHSPICCLAHEIKTQWPTYSATITLAQPLPPSGQIFGLLQSLFYYFLCNTRLFSLGNELPQHTISLKSSCTLLSLLLTPCL